MKPIYSYNVTLTRSAGGKLVNLDLSSWRPEALGRKVQSKHEKDVSWQTRSCHLVPYSSNHPRDEHLLLISSGGSSPDHLLTR